jgi:hypothetical protein
VVADNDSALGLAIVPSQEIVEVLLALNVKVDTDKRVAYAVERVSDIVVEVEALVAC